MTDGRGKNIRFVLDYVLPILRIIGELTLSYARPAADDNIASKRSYVITDSGASYKMNILSMR